MNKEELLILLRKKRKLYGNKSKEVYQMIYKIAKTYPYYDGYAENWYKNNYRLL